MKPVAAIVAPAPITTAKLWATAKDAIAKAHKLQAEADEQHKVAGRALLALKLDHDRQGGTWAQWERLVKERAGIGKSRASELMRIAGGKTTADEVRADTADRTAKAREQSSPLRSGENAGRKGSHAQRAMDNYCIEVEEGGKRKKLYGAAAHAYRNEKMEEFEANKKRVTDIIIDRSKTLCSSLLRIGRAKVYMVHTFAASSISRGLMAQSFMRKRIVIIMNSKISLPDTTQPKVPDSGNKMMRLKAGAF